MDLMQRLKGPEILIFDGAMGTQLDQRKAPMGGGANLTHPEAVLDIHREYIKAGVDVLITNTLTMNRISIESQSLGIDVEQVNCIGAKLAKEAAVGKCFVVGDISSTGQLLEPYGSYTEEAFVDNFKEQASVLAHAGVDGLIIETVFDLREGLCALKACREAAPNLPAILSLTFSTVARGCRTIMGNSAADLAKAAEENGAAAVGTNCGDLSPEEVSEVIAELRANTSLPIIAMPNAGKPKLEGETTLFEMTPEQFASGVMECIKKGAVMVGGCCGTSPDHIRELAKLVKNQ
ncbi:MAG TPA: homocysteine S-methyltransferase family protein [Bacillota bacterium]|nr:homocysteine S-methyltransferase family protein [Bacillota bacterium]